MIHTIVSYAPTGTGYNLGRAYNESMARLGEKDWACLVDHDAMFTTPVWYTQLEAAIRTDPEGAFTAVTNRMQHPWQVAAEARAAQPLPPRQPGHCRPPRLPECADDILEHRRIGAERLRHQTLLNITDTRGWGGILMLLSKRAWLEAGGFVDGLLCVDHIMHQALRACGRTIWMIEGLYLYHFHGTTGARSGGRPPRHIPVAAGCACASRPEGTPTRRIRMSR